MIITARIDNSILCFVMTIHSVYLFYYVSALQSNPNRSTPANTSINELHPTGRRWKRRRKQQRFLHSPQRTLSTYEEAALVGQLGYLPPNICCVSAKSGDIMSTTAATNFLLMDGEIDASASGVGRPVAIRSYPLLIQQYAKDAANDESLESEGNSYKNCHVTPFPTMYWLSDVHISRAISELERQGFVRDFQLRLESDASLAKEWLGCHEAYALERWELLSNQDREWLLRDDVEDLKEKRTLESMRDMIQSSGVAGTDYKGQKQEPAALGGMFVPSVKCLHSHYAHYRSQLCSDTGNIFDTKLNVVGAWTHELLLHKFSDLVF